ncbi:MAG: hypothetical protein P4L53_01400 [Candidatus Obscuribacterales bacterium]|nr:hypothetical protein [Candidatus Obscuribacterales bacterium]
MKFDNVYNLEAFNLAEPVLACFAKTKNASSVIHREPTPEEECLSESMNWLIQIAKRFQKRDVEQSNPPFESFLASAVVAYEYRGCSIMFKLRSNFASEHPPLSLSVRSDIPDVGGLLLFYNISQDAKWFHRKQQFYPSMDSWLNRKLLPKPLLEVANSPMGKKIPTLIERNFARHDFSLYCNNESWGAKFADSAALKAIIPLIPELTDFRVGFGAIQMLHPKPCLNVQAEGKMIRMDIYENIARLTEACLDILLLTAAQ